MSSVSGLKLGKELCDVFNLDPKKVQHITINAHAKYPATVEVSYIIHEEEANKLVNILKKYDIEQNDTSPEITGNISTITLSDNLKKDCSNCYYSNPPLLVTRLCFKCENFNKWRAIKK